MQLISQFVRSLRSKDTNTDVTNYCSSNLQPSMWKIGLFALDLLQHLVASGV